MLTKINELKNNNLEYKIFDLVLLYYWATNKPEIYKIVDIDIKKNKIKVVHNEKGPLKNGPSEIRNIDEIINKVIE